MKKLLAIILAALMVLCILPTAAFAEGNDNSVPVWPEEGSIHLEKSAEKANIAGFNDAWEITLKVSGKNYKTTSDVVLVIDNSNSMYDDGRMAKTKTAAIAFANELLTEGSSTRIALVVYATNVRSFTGFYDYNTKAELITKINAISKEANNNNGGTNQQAGIHKAQELLASAASTGKNKSMVILSDGEATYSHPFTATATYSNCEAWSSIGCPRGGSLTGISAFTPNYNKIIGEGDSFNMSYNAEVSAICPKHNKTNTHNRIYNLDGTHTASGGTNNGVATIWEANQAKAAGTTIYSVALQAGTNGENTLKACASDPVKGYFAIGANETDVAGKLTEAFTTIAGSIAIAAKNGVVNDQMSEFVDVYFDTTHNAPIITNDLDAYNAGNADIYISQGTAAFEGEPEKIIWQVGNVNEDDPSIMKYRVIAK